MSDDESPKDVFEALEQLREALAAEESLVRVLAEIQGEIRDNRDFQARLQRYLVPLFLGTWGPCCDVVSGPRGSHWQLVSARNCVVPVSIRSCFSLEPQTPPSPIEAEILRERNPDDLP